MKKTHSFSIIFFPILTFLLLSFLILVQSPMVIIHHYGVCEDHSHFIRECVRDNPSFKDTALTKISLLGSHDALSNDINKNSIPNSSEDNLVNIDWLRIMGKGAIVRYSRAQYHDIYTQLNVGVRYVDIRVTNINGEFYNSHGLVSNRFDVNLLKILKFLDENPGEFVLLQICAYYKGQSSDLGLKQMMESVTYNNKNVFDYINYDTSIREFKNLTYNNITDNGTKAGVVLFASPNEVNIAPFNQINYSYYNSHWHNTIDEASITEKIVEYARYGKEVLGDDYLRINQAQQTPNMDEIFGALCSWSLLSMAEEHNARMVNREDIFDILDGLPIYMCDYTTCNSNNFNTNIINKMYQRNISL